MSNYIPNNQSSAEKDLDVAENNYSAIEKMYDNFIVTPITKKAEEETKKIIVKLGCQDDGDNILKKINIVSDYVSSIGKNTAAIQKAISEDEISGTFAGVIDEIRDNTDSSLGKVADKVDRISEKLETANENLTVIKEAIGEEQIEKTFAGVIDEIRGNTDSSLGTVENEVDKISQKLETANENLSAVKAAIAEEKIGETFAEVITKIQNNTDTSLVDLKNKVNSFSDFVRTNNKTTVEKLDAVFQTSDEIKKDIINDIDKKADVISSTQTEIFNNIDSLIESVNTVKTALSEDFENKVQTITDAFSQDKSDSFKKFDTSAERIQSDIKTVNEEICVLKEKTKSITLFCENYALINEKLKKIIVALLVANIISVAEATALIVLFFFR